ncbi:MAG: response regulator [Proteobacteria bacterium]|nr:response regulator [Pseudomonadota bacterium]
MSRILLVEDDADLAEIWTELLELLGHEVTWAATLQALRATVPGSIDLAIVDWTLPDGSGSDALAHIATHYPDAKAVVTTGHDESTVPNGIHGVSAVLRKPFRIRELREVVTKLTSA